MTEEGPRRRFADVSEEFPVQQLTRRDESAYLRALVPGVIPTEREAVRIADSYREQLGGA